MFNCTVHNEPRFSSEIPFQIDKQLASGEYFLKERERKMQKRTAKRQKQVDAATKQKQKRAQAFVPPPEITKPATSGTRKTKQNDSVDVKSLKRKVKKHKQRAD